jgi:hypothetical protein
MRSYGTLFIAVSILLLAVSVIAADGPSAQFVPADSPLIQYLGAWQTDTNEYCTVHGMTPNSLPVLQELMRSYPNGTVTCYDALADSVRRVFMVPTTETQSISK